MNLKLLVSTLAVSTAFVLAAGCSVDTSNTDDGDDEAASQDELSANAAKLAGGWGKGSSTVIPEFQGIYFRHDGTFFADVDTGLRCIKAPCPSNERVEGKFTATKTKLTLKAASAGAPASDYFGKYTYSLVGKKLTLRRASFDIGQAWVNTLAGQDSYCQAASDCSSENLMQPKCVGAWSCSPASNTCGYKCGGVPVSEFWPAEKIVASSPGGGFTPPAPVGSKCTYGFSNFTLDVATKHLSWQICDTSASPFVIVSNTATITNAELAKVATAMKAINISTSNTCGADKPMKTLKVTVGGVETEYKDSFYACQGGATYIDNIGAVFSALNSAAN